MLRGSFYIILAIQNQFSEVENSKFYEILQQKKIDLEIDFFINKIGFSTKKTKKQPGKIRKNTEKPGKSKLIRRSPESHQKPPSHQSIPKPVAHKAD